MKIKFVHTIYALTIFSPVDFSILINGMSPFPVLGVYGDLLFFFHQAGPRSAIGRAPDS